jgi:hypothetical protein
VQTWNNERALAHGSKSRLNKKVQRRFLKVFIFCFGSLKLGYRDARPHMALYLSDDACRRPKNLLSGSIRMSDERS